MRQLLFKRRRKAKQGAKARAASRRRPPSLAELPRPLRIVAHAGVTACFVLFLAPALAVLCTGGMRPFGLHIYEFSDRNDENSTSYSTPYSTSLVDADNVAYGPVQHQLRVALSCLVAGSGVVLWFTFDRHFFSPSSLELLEARRANASQRGL